MFSEVFFPIIRIVGTIGTILILKKKKKQQLFSAVLLERISGNRLVEKSYHNKVNIKMQEKKFKFYKIGENLVNRHRSPKLQT